jgi:hypothetical protein
MTTGSRRPWFGIVGIVFGCLAIAVAVLPIFVVPLMTTQTPKPRDTGAIERLQGIKDRILPGRHRVEHVEPERNAPTRNFAWYEVLFLTGVTLGALAVIFSAMSWFAGEPWRLGVTAGTLGAGAILIEAYLVLVVISLVIAVLTAMFGGP